MTPFVAPERRVPLSLLVAFCDLTHYFRFSSTLEPERLADLLDGFYELVDARVRASGGHVVKYIGDAALVVFAEERADDGVRGLLELKRAADDWLAKECVPSSLQVKAHLGTVIAGPFGAAGEKRFDVLGEVVNIAARLQAKPFAISPQVFRRLAPETRRAFKKHTPPVSYIRAEDSHA